MRFCQNLASMNQLSPMSIIEMIGGEDKISVTSTVAIYQDVRVVERLFALR